MSVIVNERPQTKVNAYYGVNFSCLIKLSDTEQIIVDVPEMTYDYNASKYVKTGGIKKYRLEELSYGIGYGEEHQVKLEHIRVRGFRKDGGLRYRQETLWHLTDEALKEVIAQIPDEYHNYAREEFAYKMVELQENLTKLTNNGVKIG